LLLFMSIKEMSSLKSKNCANNTRLRIRMTSNGKRTPESTGILKEETSIFALLMSLSCMLTSSSEQKKDFVSQVSPISAISPFLRLLVCTMVVLQLVQPEQEKQRQSRILDVLSVFMSSSPTALMSTSIEIWLRFSKVFPNLDFGAASMNSTESLSQLFLSLQLKLSQSHLLRNKVLRDSCSQTLKSQLCSSQLAPISLQ
jgi:hypothetical protein